MLSLGLVVHSKEAQEYIKSREKCLGQPCEGTPCEEFPKVVSTRNHTESMLSWDTSSLIKVPSSETLKV